MFAVTETQKPFASLTYFAFTKVADVQNTSTDMPQQLGSDIFIVISLLAYLY